MPTRGMSKVKSKRYIIVTALASEAYGLEDLAPLVYTGIGKVNAAIHLYDAILAYQPEQVINYGTAGAIRGHSGLSKIDTYIQRDMDGRALGFARGVTPFSNQPLPAANGIVLGSGDCFVTDAEKELEGLAVALDLVDMEGFALHAVCGHLNIAFESYKYVSDNANDAASDDWQENIAKGTAAFRELVEREYGESTLLKAKSQA